MSEIKPAFEHFDLHLIDPPFSSQLATHVVALEQLRHDPIATTTPAPIFDQIRELFHLVESVGSARIEGNHTTMTDYVQTQLDGNAEELQSEQIKEIANIEQALKFIESNVKQGDNITHGLVRELHKIVVESLVKEGIKIPGCTETIA